MSTPAAAGRPGRELVLQRLVIAGVVDELAKALHREARPGIGGEQYMTQPAAPFDQRIGHDLGQRLAARDGLEMLVGAAPRTATDRFRPTPSSVPGLAAQRRFRRLQASPRSGAAAADCLRLAPKAATAADIDIFEDAQNDFLEQSVLGDVAFGDAVEKQIRDASQRALRFSEEGSRANSSRSSPGILDPDRLPFEVSM